MARGLGEPLSNSGAPSGRSKAMLGREALGLEEWHENNAYVAYLNAFSIYGQGDTLENARRDLLEEIEEYRVQWNSDEGLRRDPTRRMHGALLRIIEDSSERGNLTAWMFGDE